MTLRNLDNFVQGVDNDGMNRQEIYRLLDSIANQVQQVRDLIKSPHAKTNEEAILRAEKGLCTYCGEKILSSERVIRGAHSKCHKKINRAINSLQLTDEQVVNRGWLLAGEKGGRRIPEDEPLAAAATTLPRRKKIANRKK